MFGLMQDWPLTLDKVIEHACTNHPHREVVTRSIEGPIERSDYETIWRRAKQVSHGLREHGVAGGDRVATLAWNTARHLEVWYGVSAMGAVLHTINPRLPPDQLVWIANHAGGRILFLDLTFVPMIEKLAAQLETIERFVILTDAAHMPQTNLKNAIAYEDYIVGRPLDTPWGGFDERTAAGLCYTSGTTGDPKGVLYSHRSNVLHAMAIAQPDGFGCGSADNVLAIVPMFHANAWALTFLAPMVGAKLVMPGARLDGESVFDLLESEAITFSAGVPTVWQMLLNYLDETGKRFSTLKRVGIGGAAAPESMVRAFEEKHGVSVIHAWGMTEMSPVGTIGALLPAHEGADLSTRIKTKTKQGRSFFTVEMKTVDEDGRTLARDGASSGRLLVRGPAVAQAYFRGAGARNAQGGALERCGFFDTGDIATIDAEGYMQITDRAKDVIKSGGEWISSIDIENAAIGATGVANAAVIAVNHPKWNERPLLIIEPKPGEAPDKAEILAYLTDKIAKWQMPDDVVLIEKIPLGATGKINKLALRKQFLDYKLPTAN